jgi:hypothetical protein
LAIRKLENIYWYWRYEAWAQFLFLPFFYS